MALLRARSRSHGRARAFFCGLQQLADVPMAGRYLVLEALLDDVLDESMVSGAIEALCLLAGDSDEDRLGRSEAELAGVSRERDRLVAAIASGGQPP